MEMDKNLRLHMEIVGAQTVEALEKNGFLAEFLPDRNAARERLLALIPDGAGVGFGGSMTVKALDIQAELTGRGCAIYDHHLAKDPAEADDFRLKQQTCDLFLCSSNAITRDGKLYNVDGAGNRVAAMIYGPKEVVIVAGINKVVADLTEAEERVCAIAGPVNNIRLNTGNPCTKTGECMNCSSAGSICNIATILHRCPSRTKIRVLLVGESMGF
ncbi:MAG: lactate utilization protein [Clostridiales bacterium]|nr:lactate utilization protein [Clostridiales bacterium]